MRRWLFRALSLLLVGAHLGILTSDALAADAPCHCHHEADDPTPCPCPMHRHATHSGDDDMPCPMHHAAATPALPGMHAGCGAGPAQLAVTPWVHFSAAAVRVPEPVALPSSPSPEPLAPESVRERPARPPPRSA